MGGLTALTAQVSGGDTADFTHDFFLLIVIKSTPQLNFFHCTVATAANTVVIFAFCNTRGLHDGLELDG
ncbi:hypothetical protein ABT56_18665 [Photobacterium aquae]|uniref:Uncharacterized protein n=1 Tax=Photobacterium aquae TaxID=1195763 RepID=A0A0J1GVF1_9GAMM|nr:hypothetical protein ABT56_18665 [Photobacterium aquae]